MEQKNFTVIFSIITVIVASIALLVVWQNRGSRVAELPSPATERVPVVTTTPPNNDLQQPSIISESSTTTALFTGHYSSTKTYEDKTGVKACYVFTVYKSDDPLFVYFVDLVRRGNTVNSLDENGNLLLKLETGALTENNKAEITTSTANTPISLRVQKKVFSGKGATPCTSFIDILAIQ